MAVLSGKHWSNSDVRASSLFMTRADAMESKREYAELGSKIR